MRPSEDPTDDDPWVFGESDGSETEELPTLGGSEPHRAKPEGSHGADLQVINTLVTGDHNSYQLLNTSRCRV
jgi:hypothetical protein